MTAANVVKQTSQAEHVAGCAASSRDQNHCPAPASLVSCASARHIFAILIVLLLSAQASAVLPLGENIRTQCKRLKVDQTGRIGIAPDAERPSRFFAFHDETEILRDGSLILGNSATSLSWTIYGGAGCTPLDSVSPLVYDTGQLIPGYGWMPVYRFAIGTGETHDKELGFEVSWFAPTHPESCHAFVGVFRVYKGTVNPTGTVSNLTISYAADWDISPLSSNQGGVDAMRQMIYQTSGTQYAAIAARRDDELPIVGGFVWENSIHVDPQSTFDQTDLWNSMEALAQGQYTTTAASADLSSVLVVGRDITIDGAIGSEFKFVLVVAGTIGGGNLGALRVIVDKALIVACGKQKSAGPLDFCAPPCGDVDGGGMVTIADVVFLINYIFAGGPAPYPLSVGDPDCNGSVSIADAIYLINYIFAGGAAPCAGC